MITDAMVLAAAKAMYLKTKTASLVVWDLLPRIVQDDMLNLARVALEAAEELR
jgi:hypothetical protein